MDRADKWWCISEPELVWALECVRDGESVEVVMMEMVANATSQEIEY